MWQALHARHADAGLTVVTVALDVEPSFARPFIEAAAPAHPSLIDTCHVTDEAFGFTNVPMAVWIDEQGVLVRPAEYASLDPRRLVDIPDGAPERMRGMLEQVNAIPDLGTRYRDAVADWVANGAASRFALGPDEVVARSQPRPAAHAEAAACFALGEHLRRHVGAEAAVGWWRRAHALHPENWTYKRQAWTLVTTPAGADAPDLTQPPTDTYAGGWLEDVLALGGGAAYYGEIAPEFTG